MARQIKRWLCNILEDVNKSWEGKGNDLCACSFRCRVKGSDMPVLLTCSVPEAESFFQCTYEYYK